jgi:hypothetical protein
MNSYHLGAVIVSCILMIITIIQHYDSPRIQVYSSTPTSTGVTATTPGGNTYTFYPNGTCIAATPDSNILVSSDPRVILDACSKSITISADRTHFEHCVAIMPNQGASKTEYPWLTCRLKQLNTPVYYQGNHSDMGGVYALNALNVYFQILVCQYHHNPRIGFL